MTGITTRRADAQPLADDVMLRIVAVAIHVPDVINLVLFQKLMHVLADSDQTAFVSTGDPQQLQPGFRGTGIGNLDGSV